MEISQITYIPKGPTSKLHVKRFYINTTIESVAKTKGLVLMDANINDYNFSSCIIVKVH